MDETASVNWEDRYRAVRGTYESMTMRLRALIVDLLENAHIEVIQVEARTKETASFTEKINRKGQKYSEPLVEITDIVGLRIITYYVEDVARVGSLIEAEFQVDRANSGDKSETLDPDRFGYTSVHYVVTLSSDRQGLGEWKPYINIKAEIQVRTALQHAWAAVNHKLDYKSPTEVPRGLQRRLFRLSALFELADEQFSELRDARERLASDYADDVRDGQLDIPLDEESLVAYLQNSRINECVVEIAERNNARVDPPDNSRLARDRKDLLRLIKSMKISTIAQLDAYLKAEIFSVPLSGTDIFEGRDEEDEIADITLLGIEDALTLLIMANLQVSKQVFTRYYSVDMWPAFAAGADTWNKLKKQSHAGS